MFPEKLARKWKLESPEISISYKIETFLSDFEEDIDIRCMTSEKEMKNTKPHRRIP